MALRLPEVLVVSLVQKKTQELQSPTCSGCCPDCLVLISRVLSDAQAIDAASRPVCHDFWNSCISMITKAWTDEELDVFRSKLRAKAAACVARAGPDHNYDVGNLGDPGDPVQKFFHALYCCLASNIVPVPGGHSALISASGPKRMFGSKRRGRWPIHPNDLIPFGARQTAEMHVHWCCSFISPMPITVLMVLLFGSRPTVFPYLLESPLRERLLWCIVQMLNADTARDTFAWPATVNYRLPEHFLNWFLTPNSSANTSVHCGVSLLDAFLSGPDAASDDLSMFYRGYEAALIPAVSSALDMQQSGSVALDGSSCGVLCRIAIDLCNHCPDVELHPLARTWQHEQSNSDDASYIASLQGHLNGCYRRRTCCGPGCTRGIHDSEDGKPLSLCAGCRFTQYCSKGCQKADWKDATWPHKSLCRILRLFVPFLQSKSSVFEEAFYALEFEDSDYELMLRWLNDQ